MTSSTLTPATPTSTLPVTDVYLVAWTGGLEEPSFASFTDPDAAQSQFDEWAAEIVENDRVSLLRQSISADGRVVCTKVNETVPHEDEPGED